MLRIKQTQISQLEDSESSGESLLITIAPTFNGVMDALWNDAMKALSSALELEAPIESATVSLFGNVYLLAS